MFFSGLWKILKGAGLGFDHHNVFKLSASLAFYTIFSIGPMMLVIIFISNLFWGRQAIEGTIYTQISGLIGDTAAMQIQQLIKNASISNKNFMAFIGIGSLLIAATTIFVDMQESMNTIWNLKVKKGRGWQQMLKNRLISFCIIAGLGIILLLFLVINGILEGFVTKITALFPEISITVVYTVNLILTLFVVTVLFAFIYKVLPDAKIRWRDVVEGSLFGAILFMIGKFGVTFYINNSNLSNTYSSAGSMVILMLWVYYSAIILYFGAEFTKAYALKREVDIKPKDYAVTIEAVLSETHEPSIQENENNPSVKDK